MQNVSIGHRIRSFVQEIEYFGGVTVRMRMPQPRTQASAE